MPEKNRRECKNGKNKLFFNLIPVSRKSKWKCLHILDRPSRLDFKNEENEVVTAEAINPGARQSPSLPHDRHLFH